MERMPLKVGDRFASSSNPEIRLCIARLQWLHDGERVIGTRHPDGGEVIDLTEEEWAVTVTEFRLMREAAPAATT